MQWAVATQGQTEVAPCLLSPVWTVEGPWADSRRLSRGCRFQSLQDWAGHLVTVPSGGDEPSAPAGGRRVRDVDSAAFREILGFLVCLFLFLREAGNLGFHVKFSF